MNQRTFLAAGLLISLALNAAVLVFFLGGRRAPQAFGQAVDSGGGYIMATEQNTDQTPVCFILRTDEPPHLVVYRLDQQGMLMLASSRDIQHDLRVPDNFFGRGKLQDMRTRPPVITIRTNVDQQEAREAQKAKKTRDQGKEKK